MGSRDSMGGSGPESRHLDLQCREDLFIRTEFTLDRENICRSGFSRFAHYVDDSRYGSFTRKAETAGDVSVSGAPPYSRYARFFAWAIRRTTSSYGIGTSGNIAQA